MSHLKTLYRSLFKVITEYHKVRTKQEISVDELMSTPPDALIPTLKPIIQKMIGSDTTRLEMLNYLCDLIQLSTPYLSNSELLTPTECFHLHAAFTTFIIKLKALCETYHDKTLVIRQDGQERVIYGLLSGWPITGLSRLGVILHSNILVHLNITKESTDESIASLISQLINDHESIKRNVENPLIEEIKTLRLENQTLRDEILTLSTAKEELSKAQEKNKLLLTKKQSIIDDYEKEISGLKEALINEKNRQTRQLFPKAQTHTGLRPPAWLSLFSALENEPSTSDYDARIQPTDS